MTRSTIFRSVLAVVIGFVTIVATHTGTDQVMHQLQIFPPPDQPMHDPALNLIAFGYRAVFTIFGSYLTATLAPQAGMEHALMLGLIGTTLSALGATWALDQNLGPAWYPIALAITAMPLAWVGGVLHQRLQMHRPDA